ncbi:hypothetical protein G3I15_48080 [Streptomyces sp. SID10244]|nr:hypothetical protein [Streptomyces sp. SID10244]
MLVVTAVIYFGFTLSRRLYWLAPLLSAVVTLVAVWVFIAVTHDAGQIVASQCPSGMPSWWPDWIPTL